MGVDIEYSRKSLIERVTKYIIEKLPEHEAPLIQEFFKQQINDK